jgi:uncharacterized protein
MDGNSAEPMGTAPGCDRDIVLFFLLACGITWSLDYPLASAYVDGATPSPQAMLLTGLGAWGPTLAALIVAGWRRELRGVFGRWRTAPIWVVLGLLYPAASHLLGTMLEVALGGQPAQWFYPPTKPEHIAAIVMFSVGEEFGWRGFAYPRMAARYGPIVGSLMLGAVWGLWHFGMLFTPANGAPGLIRIGDYMLRCALASVVIAWFFERGRRSIAVAIAIHAGAHLDNAFRIPESELRLRMLHLLVLVILAGLAARALSGHRPADRGASQPRNEPIGTTRA